MPDQAGQAPRAASIAFTASARVPPGTVAITSPVDGLVASKVATPPDGGRATRNYRLRPAGREALQHSRALLERLWDGLEAEST